MALDIHSHLYPEALASHLDSAKTQSRGLARAMRAQIAELPELATLSSTRQDLFIELGIERQVLSVPTQMVLVAAKAQAASNARTTNELLARSCASNPKEYGFWATLPLVDTEMSL